MHTFKNLGFLGLLFASSLLGFTMSQTNEYDVIIIGAGMAGISAALELIQSGVTNIVILEASDRTGGRVWTISFDNGTIEKGAQWIHGGEDANPIYKIANEAGLILEEDEKTRYYATQNGTKLDKDLINDIEEMIDQVFADYDDAVEELDPNSKTSFGYLINKVFDKYMKKLPQSQRGNISLIKALFKTRLNEEKSQVGTNDMNEVNAVASSKYEEFGGEPYVSLNCGYHKLTDLLVSKLPSSIIKLNEKVEKNKVG